MHSIHPSDYQKAFVRYLRKGIPLDVALKAPSSEHTTTHYIWRTSGDDKVRNAHAVNNGKLFRWDVRPSTGHPGEDYNCRCKAEPFIPGESEYAYQILLQPERDVENKWTAAKFIRHYYFGGGRTLELQETGHLLAIINYYLYYIKRQGADSRSRVNSEIITAARKRQSGGFTHNFYNSYTEFGDYFWPFGGGKVSGLFTGDVHHKNGMLSIQGTINYKYADIFTDPVNLREDFYHGTSDPAEASILALMVTDALGVHFDVVGRWETQFSAEVRLDAENSMY
ncbi:MAG: hypothetical protein FJX23_00130 [Alphaproteobacteria bacterium]|nr:hypothetical protein [Alphaproteobacteria bacterium]